MNQDLEISDPHEEWQELCALATANELEPTERERLRVHLSSCAECRRTLAEFQSVSGKRIPLIADEFAPGVDQLINFPGWDVNESKRSLFARLDRPAPALAVPAPSRKHVSQVGIPAWALWGGMAACLALSVGAGVHLWDHRGSTTGESSTTQLLAKVQSLTGENQKIERRLSAEDANFAQLEKQASLAKDQVSQLQQQLENAQSQVNDLSAGKTVSDQQLQAALTDRGNLAAKLENAQQAYQALQVEMTNLKAQRQADQVHYASLDVEVSDLTRQLHEAESHASDDDRYLASDRDIRELMGARQLYISDVVDVDQNGNPRKPFGRVFYTKGKSLIFYAFDLDQQAGIRQASTFQAWAREGSDRARPVSLGIFYVDSEANRRWVLKTSDPKLLAEINTVFVTVEPKGGSQKPTGKPLLYAYLKTETPNHP
jgi:multidrug efflux pump subunit AcrA (membrane-fusion protein)